jgi:hypothetical protein
MGGDAETSNPENPRFPDARSQIRGLVPKHRFGMTRRELSRLTPRYFAI